MSADVSHGGAKWLLAATAAFGVVLWGINDVRALVRHAAALTPTAVSVVLVGAVVAAVSRPGVVRRAGITIVAGIGSVVFASPWLQGAEDVRWEWPWPALMMLAGIMCSIATTGAAYAIGTSQYGKYRVPLVAGIAILWTIASVPVLGVLRVLMVAVAQQDGP